MHCANCGSKIEEGAKFCPSCGARVESKTIPNGNLKTLDAIKNHLEFLGYTVTKNEAKKEGEMNMLIAKHSKDTNFVVIEIQPSIFIFRANFTVEKPQSSQMDTAINELGGKMDVVNVFYDIDEGKVVLRCDATFTGDYSKDLFGRFFSLINKDIGKIFLLENSKKAFVN